jgi:hypothetical protein
VRTLLVGGLIAGAAILAGPGGALASDQFAATFDMRYSRNAPAVSTGLTTHMSWSDPGEPAGKPRTIKEIVLGFPGTRFDTTALPYCRASDDLLRAKGPAACPRSTRVGTGATMVNPGAGPTFGTRVTFFNARREVIVVVKAGATVISVFRDQIRTSAVIVRPIIPGGFALTDLQVRWLAHGRRTRAGRRTFFRTPATCPAEGAWTTTATFTYTDGFTQQLTSPTPCAG